MNDFTAQYLSVKIDKLLVLLERMADANERTAIACEAIASQEALDGLEGAADTSVDPDASDGAALALDKLQL